MALEDNGFRYVRKHQKQQKESSKISCIQIWVCQNRDCCGEAATNVNNDEDDEVEFVFVRFVHDSDEAGVRLHRVILTIKKRAKRNPNAPPLAILQEALGSVQDYEVLSRLPERQTLLRNINNFQNRERPTNPRSFRHPIRIRHPIRRSYLMNQRFIETVVTRYPTYKAENTIKTYLSVISYRLKRPAVEVDGGDDEED